MIPFSQRERDPPTERKKGFEEVSPAHLCVFRSDSPRMDGRRNRIPLVIATVPFVFPPTAGFLIVARLKHESQRGYVSSYAEYAYRLVHFHPGNDPRLIRVRIHSASSRRSCLRRLIYLDDGFSFRKYAPKVRLGFEVSLESSRDAELFIAAVIGGSPNAETRGNRVFAY